MGEGTKMDSGKVDETPELTRFLAGKQALRQEQTNLSYPEKIRRVIAMQEVTRALKRDSDGTVYVWNFD